MPAIATFCISLLLFSSIAANVHCQTVDHNIYEITGNDSILTAAFIKKICRAIKQKGKLDNGQMEAESLILKAADVSTKDTIQATKSIAWHNKYGNQCYCEAKDDFLEGNFLRQMVYADFRRFANIIGLHNRLPLDLTLKDSKDGRTIYKFINDLRLELEAGHDNRRFEFQQDEEWRNVMFFYFLFSEYSIK